MAYAYWADAEVEVSKVYTWDGGTFTGTPTDVVNNYPEIFAFEHGGTSYYRNIYALIPFMVDGQPAEECEIIGGVHSPQRPK